VGCIEGRGAMQQESSPHITERPLPRQGEGAAVQLTKACIDVLELNSPTCEFASKTFLAHVGLGSKDPMPFANCLVKG